MALLGFVSVNKLSYLFCFHGVSNDKSRQPKIFFIIIINWIYHTNKVFFKAWTFKIPILLIGAPSFERYCISQQTQAQSFLSRLFKRHLQSPTVTTVIWVAELTLLYSYFLWYLPVKEETNFYALYTNNWNLFKLSWVVL